MQGGLGRPCGVAGLAVMSGDQLTLYGEVFGDEGRQDLSAWELVPFLAFGLGGVFRAAVSGAKYISLVSRGIASGAGAGFGRAIRMPAYFMVDAMGAPTRTPALPQWVPFTHPLTPRGPSFSPGLPTYPTQVPMPGPGGLLKVLGHPCYEYVEEAERRRRFWYGRFPMDDALQLAGTAYSIVSIR